MKHLFSVIQVPEKTLVVFLFLTGWFMGVRTAAGQVVRLADGAVVAPAPQTEHICTIEPTYEDVYYFKKAEEMAAKSLNARTADFQVTYINVCGGGQSWPAQARNAFEYAIGIWESHLQSSVPIRIEARWIDLESNVLGSAGPTRIVRNIAGGEPETWYSIAQASAIANRDFVNEISDEDFDIVINMNCNFDRWHLETDADPGAGQIDLVTVVLHEIGHGIGFTGSMSGNENAQSGSWGLGEVMQPIIMDRFTRDGSGVLLLDEGIYPNPSALLYDALTGQRGGVLFNGMDASGTFQDRPVPLYAPYPWDPGSSYSHVDQDTFGRSENALMRPRMDNAFAIHSPGPVFCGILSDTGWPLGASCLAMLGTESIIAVDRREVGFGVSNVGRIVEKILIITNESGALEAMSGSIETEGLHFSLSGDEEAFTLEPGESVEVTLRYQPRNAREHISTVQVYHNASNLPSPVSIPVSGEALEADKTFVLEQNYPNPFNSTTNISYAVSGENSRIRLDIYTLTGQHIQSLVNSIQGSGRYIEEFDGSGLSSGIYLYRILVDGAMETQKLMLVK